MKLRTLASSLAASLLLAIIAPAAALASSASLYVSPASGTVAVGSIIPVQIRVNTGGDPVNAVQGNISYNASALAYQSLDTAGSAFSLTANTVNDSGLLKMARAVGGGEAPVSGDFLFGTVYFKALTTAGTASVAIAADSHVVRSTDSVDIIAGAKAASGTKAPATGAPKPTTYPTLAKAQAAVAALATPTPVPTATPVTASGNTNNPTPTPATSAPATTDTKVLAWNSPMALGGLAVLLVLVGVIVYAYLRRRKLGAAAAASTVPSASVYSGPHGSVDSKTGVINSETIYPNNPSNDSDQIQR